MRAMRGVELRSVAALMVTAVASGYAASRADRIVADLEGSTILVVAMDTVSGCGRGQACMAVHVHRHVVSVIHDAGPHEGPFSAFEVDIRIWAREFSPPPWTTLASISAKDQFIVQTRPKRDFGEMIRQPEMVLPLKNHEWSVNELQLVLSTAHQSVDGRAAAVAKAIRETPSPGASLLNYAIGLVHEGSDAGTQSLMTAIENSDATRFSESAKRAVLWGIFDWAREESEPPDRALHLLVVISARYLVMPDDMLSDSRVRVVKEMIPLILGSERARAMVQRELGPSLARQVRERALEIANGRDYTAEDHTRLRELAQLVGGQQ